MLKHSDLIEKLDILQKVALISSALEEEPFVQAGLPPVKKQSLSALAREGGLSYGSAARSWNPELVANMTGELVEEGKIDGAKLFITPDLKTAVNPYESGLSEDPYLNGVLGGEILRAVKRAGGASGLFRPSAGDKDIAYLDKAESPCAVHELMVKPFLTAVKACPCDAVFIDPSREGKNYYNANRTVFNEAQNGLFGDVMIVGDGKINIPDAVSLLSGRVILGGSSIAVERAARRYLQLVAYESEGSVAHREIEESIADFAALDTQKIDEIVDGIIDFALTLSAEEKPEASGEPAPEQAEDTAAEEGAQGEDNAENQTETYSAGEEISAEEPTERPVISDEWRKACAAESVVLLKNNGILPLRAGEKVAVIGDFYSDLQQLKATFYVTGTAKGYDRARARSESYIPVALRAASDAEVVLVFLAPDATGRELALPPNRIALLDALKRGGKKVIALVTGDLPADMSFDGYADALLLVPDDGRFASAALARILGGEINPSGRLTRTPYDGADEYFRAIREDRAGAVYKIGSFTGYRRYTTEGKKVRYPFGFGLGYTQFKYSSPALFEDRVEFTLTNVGETDGFEVAQLYIGAPSKSHVAPAKQLRAFQKVFLKAGESTRISFPVSDSTFESYDPLLYADGVEAGEYTLYIGASSQDIRLTGKAVRRGAVRTATTEKKADYFPDYSVHDGKVASASRVIRRRSEAPENIKHAKNIVLYAMPVVALVFFLLVSTLILSYALDYVLLSVADRATVEWSLYVIAVGVLALVPLLGSLSRRRLALIRTIGLVATPVLIVVSFILGGILLSGKGGLAEDISLRIVTCLAVGVPIAAVVAALIERQLRRTRTGKNRWDKYYFERVQEERTTSDGDFEEAFSACEEANKRRAERAAQEDEEFSAPVREAVRFYDKQLTFVQLLGDLTKFLAERGLLVEEDTLKNYVAAVFSTRLIIVPAGGGAALAAAAAEYFGKKAYIDNAESYERYVDMFMKWRQSGNASYPTNLSDALVMARRESAYLHTAVIRHVQRSVLLTLFSTFADVISRRRELLPTVGGKELPLPPNLLVVIELDDCTQSDIPAAIAEVAAFVSPVVGECEQSERKTVLQSVGFERVEAMLKLVRDYYPLEEELWKKVDALDEKCRAAHIGNKLWLKLETHSSIISAFGDDGNESLDGAIACELLPWLISIWGKNGESLPETLAEIFGKERIGRVMAILKGGDGA